MGYTPEQRRKYIDELKAYSKERRVRERGYHLYSCPSCGAQNPSPYRFCGKCGVDLGGIIQRDTQEARNRKIFAEVFSSSVEQIQKNVHDRLSLDICCAWFYGATRLSTNLVADLPFIEKAWAKGDKEKAARLCEACLYPMISKWARRYEKQVDVADEQKNDGRIESVSGILYALGTMSKEKGRDFLNLDAQYSYEMDKWESKEVHVGLLYYTTLLTSKLCEAVGLRQFIDWGKQAFPVEATKDIKYAEGNDPYGRLYDYRDIVNIILLMSQSGAEMFEAFGKARARK